MSAESSPLLLDIDQSGETGGAGSGGLRPKSPGVGRDVRPWMQREFDFSKEKKIDGVYFFGVFLAFWLVFSMWCLWSAFLEYSTLDQGGYPNPKSVFINVGTISGCLLVLVILRFGVGPVLGPFARSLFSLVLVFFAICFWETLEGAIAVLVKDDLKTEASVYGVMLLLGLGATAIYEYKTNYDVVGNHLLL